MGEKTEKATPKKLRDAKKKGQVAKSQDFPAAFTFIVSISVTLGLMGYLYEKISSFLILAFQSVNQPQLSKLIVAFFYEGFSVIFLSSIPVLIAVIFIGVLANFLSVGPVFATEVFKFDIKKFDPIQNLKSKFKMKTLVELLKQLLKISIAAILIYRVMYKSVPILIHMMELPMEGALYVFYTFLLDVVFQVGLFFIAVGIFDLAYQKYNFGKEMMMEKFEVKQEHKNSEGDPQIKGKRKQVAQELAYSDGPAAAIRHAKALVVNPTHIAVAVGYDREIADAPFILAMGQDSFAKYLIKLAKKYEVPVLRNVPLARHLWQHGELYSYVPEETYAALAEIVQWINTLEEGQEFEAYDPKAEIQQAPPN